MNDETTRSDALDALLGLWRRRKRLALLAFSFLAVPAIALIFGLPDIYQAQATILVERESLPASVSRPGPGRSDEIETRIRALGQETLSRERLTGLIDKYGLYASFRAEESAEQIIRRMRTDTAVTMDRKTGDDSPTVSVTLSYRGPNPKTVAEVANTLAGWIVEGRGEERERQATSTAEMIRAQLEDVQKRMDEQERKLGAYKARHRVDLPEQLPANIAALERLNAQLQQNGEWQIRAAERRDEAQRVATIASGAAADEPDVKLGRLRAELDGLRAKYSETHPDVVRLKEEVRSLETQPRSATTTRPASPPSASAKAYDLEMRTLRSQEADLKRAIASYQSRVESAPTRDQELQELTRDYEATKELYASLFQRETEARLAGRLEQNQAGERLRVLDPALTPRSPHGPDRYRLLALALAASLGIAIAGALLVERCDSTFHSSDQLRLATPVTVLGSLPRLRTTAQTVREGLVSIFGAVAGVAALALAAGASYWMAQGNEALASLALRLGS
jgi:protein tyrosine kinase modulator